MSRELDIGTRKYTKVYASDSRGTGGASHRYVVANVDGKALSEIAFQDGPVKEAGVNGIHNEDLIAIVIDRLQGFQAGDFSCRENALALTKLEEAGMWLRKRTTDREVRGVEGTSEK